MTDISNKKLTHLAVLELYHLKNKATKAELNRLDLVSLNPISGISCIYGQMTGSCNSNRAVELAKELPYSFTRVIANNMVENPKKNNEVNSSFTALEVYTYKCSPTQLKYCVNFLKDKKTTIKIKKLYL